MLQEVENTYSFTLRRQSCSIGESQNAHLWRQRREVNEDGPDWSYPQLYGNGDMPSVEFDETLW